MKIKLFYWMLILALLSLSCNKENSEAFKIDSQKVQEVSSFKSISGSMVVAFNILNPSEKAFAFKTHLMNSSKHLNLSDEQMTFINALTEIIVPEMYMNDAAEKYKGIVAKMEYNAFRLFTAKDYVYLFENINDKNSLMLNPSGPGDCFCNWNSTCTPYADTAGPDCIEGLNSCTQTNSGCGFLWLSPCKGKCGRLPA